MVTSLPSGPTIVAKVLKNMKKIRNVAVPKYKVWILCHMVMSFVV